jgi:hypothetical protein
MTIPPISLHLAAAIVLGTLAPAAAQEAPFVVTTTPAHLAIDVDAGKVRELVVTFDQDMDPTVHAVCGGGPTFPPIRATSWRDARTFVLEVDLQPDRVYWLDLACRDSSGFRSAKGLRLPPKPWRFATQGPPLPEGAAEQATQRLFTALRDHYSYRDRLGIDWHDLEQQRRAGLAEAPCAATFVLRLVELLGVPQDPHISVQWREVALPTFQREVTPNYDFDRLRQIFPKLAPAGRIAWTARTDDDIGYLWLGSFAREQRSEFERALDALRALGDCKALVLDVRGNSGGDEALARRLAGFFVQGAKVYAAHRVRDPGAPGGFRDRQSRIVEGNPAPDVFPGAVAVLMGPTNMSSAEAFLLMMKQAQNAVLVGGNSFGSSGNPIPHPLLPGVAALLPSWQALLPDGTCFEGLGISPHIEVPAKAEQFAERDPVLDEALQRLRGKR